MPRTMPRGGGARAGVAVRARDDGHPWACDRCTAHGVCYCGFDGTGRCAVRACVVCLALGRCAYNGEHLIHHVRFYYAWE